jgi:hypothetical protein
MQSSLRPKRRAMLLRRAAAEEHEVRQQTLFASEERDEYAAKSRHNPIIADTTARARKAKQSERGHDPPQPVCRAPSQDWFSARDSDGCT